MLGDLAFACRCGALGGTLSDMGPSAATHVRCHCADCRGAYAYLGRPDPGPVGILQTTQDRVAITRGAEHLRAFRHTPRGPLRWYAGCCGTPFFYTPLKARLVHVGVNVDALADPAAAGPVEAEGFVPSRKGPRHVGAGRMVMRMAARMLARNLGGQWRATPFFDGAGRPVVEPHVLGRDERAAALRGVQA